MQVTPDFSAFESIYQSGQTQVVSTTLNADLETPVSAMIKLAKGQPNSFLLESVEGGSIRGRYSFIGLKPDLIWRCYGDRAEINRTAIEDTKNFLPCPVADKDGALASFGLYWLNLNSIYQKICRPWHRGYLVIWAMTWCVWLKIFQIIIQTTSMSQMANIFGQRLSPSLIPLKIRSPSLHRFGQRKIFPQLRLMRMHACGSDRFWMILRPTCRASKMTLILLGYQTPPLI